MVPSPRAFTAALRRAPIAAAFLALALQLLFPAGFMAAEPGQGHGLSVVICTVHGQATADWDALTAGHSKKAPAKRMACAFAGHATASGPPTPKVLAEPAAFVHAAVVFRPSLVFPGRGLPAPPPPSTGPPIHA